jgi:hypothetical protein
VHALQDKFSIVPLSSYGKAYTPPPAEVDASFDMKTAVREQVDSLNTVAFFQYLAKLMKDNPPSAVDASMVATMAKIGIVPGQEFNSSKLGLLDDELLRVVPKYAVVKIMEHFKHAGTRMNGWMFTTKTGEYGTDYEQRPLITAIGLGANRPQDAVYPTSREDADARPYDGASDKYVMHFKRGKCRRPTPSGPSQCTTRTTSSSPIPLNRYTLSSRDKFVTNADGSVDLYLQAESPGKAEEPNWLPAPKGHFIPMLRLYWPKENPPSILDGTWKIPAINRAP